MKKRTRAQKTHDTSRARSPRRLSIGLLSDSLSNDYAVSLLQGAVDMARQHDVNLLCFPGRVLRDPDAFETQGHLIYELVGRENIDGLVISGALGVYAKPAEIAAFCKRYFPMPMVNVGLAIEGMPSLTVDNYASMCEAITHLIRVHGYRRIAFICGPQNNTEAKDRYSAYVDTLLEHQIPLDPALVLPGDFRPGAGRAAVSLLLDQHPARVEAIVAANDDMALSALAALQARGIRVPADVALMGFDAIKEGEASLPPLTTVQQPIYEFGQRAVEMVLAQLAGQPVPDQVDLPTTLLIRQSCGCPDQLVLQAGAGSGQEPAAVIPGQAGVTDLAAKAKGGPLFPDGLVLSAVLQALGPHTARRSGLAQQCLESFVTATNQRAPAVLLQALEQILGQAALAGDSIAAWQAALSILRQWAIAHLDNDTRLWAEDMWGQARVTIGVIAQRVQLHAAIEAERRARRLGKIGQALIVTFDFQRLAAVLAEGLPQLGISSYYLCLYDDPAAPAQGARLIAAHDKRGPIELEAGGQRFPSRQLVPGGLAREADQAHHFVIEPLYFRGDPLGFMIFERGPHDGWVYEMLRGQISSAVKGALLLQERERAEKALAKAYAEIEKQVQERTAELQQEIVERQQAQEALAYEQRLMQALMETIPDRIYFKDSASRFIRISHAHARRFGLNDPGEAIGKTDFDFFVEEDARNLYEQEQAIIRTGQSLIGMEEKKIRLDGQIYWSLATKVPLRDEEGQIVGICGISKDITKLKKAEEALRQYTAELEARNEELDAFAHTAAHDLQGPLGIILGYTEIIETDHDVLPPAELQKSLHTVARNARKMGNIVHELLLLAEVRKTDVPSARLDMPDILLEAQERLIDLVREYGAKIRPLGNGPFPNGADAWPVALGYGPWVEEIWVNYLSNAIKYGGQPPYIALGASQEAGGMVRFWIRDNGAGLTPEEQSRLFRPFTRLDQVRAKGHGLGLSIVRRIAEKLGGQVGVESQLGVGSTFSFSLPAADPTGLEGTP
ncbi:MAG: substrate-binding domain-containing protein [Thermoflexales bacterium]|nr:substrate-binding domain-containing protein [Thermoflexales bacterium]